MAALKPLEGPAPERFQHTPIAREVTMGLLRHRVRPILTPFERRLAILDEIAALPESKRLRSARRRLTMLDRALSNREARALERLTSCLESLGSVRAHDPREVEVRSAPCGRLPFGETQRREIGAAGYVLAHLTPPHRSAVLELAALLDPSQSLSGFKPGGEFIEFVKPAAEAVASLYEECSQCER